MNITEAFILMMKENRFTYRALADRLGMKSIGSLTTLKTDNAARAAKFIRVCEECGYGLYFKSSDTQELVRIVLSDGTSKEVSPLFRSLSSIDAIKAIKEASGMSYRDMANALGYGLSDSATTKNGRPTGGLANLGQHSDVDMGRMLRIAEVCRCQIILRPLKPDRRLPITLHYEPSKSNIEHEESKRTKQTEQEEG